VSWQEPWLDEDDEGCEGPVVYCEHCNSDYATIVTVLSDHTEYACPVCEAIVWLEVFGD
jgi:hypothetical protein